MDLVLHRRLAVMLVAFGIAGLVVAVGMVPTGLAAMGFDGLLRSPLVYGLFLIKYAAAVVTVLSVLLFVAGGREGHVGAGLGAAVVVGYLVANWRIQLAMADSGNPQLLFALVFATLIGVVCISALALVTARGVRRGVTQAAQASLNEGV